MAVQVWIGEKPEHPNERRAIVALANGLERFEGLYLILANFSVGGRSIDLVIIKQDAVFIIELKHCDGKVIGGVNGPWYVESANGDRKRLNPGRKNPYNQVISYFYSLTNYLNEQRPNFLAGHKTTSVDFRTCKRVVVIAPTIQAGSQIELDWKVELKGLDELPAFLITERSSEVDLSEEEMLAIPRMLNCTHWNDVNALLGGVLPDWEALADPATQPVEPATATVETVETSQPEAPGAPEPAVPQPAWHRLRSALATPMGRVALLASTVAVVLLLALIFRPAQVIAPAPDQPLSLINATSDPAGGIAPGGGMLRGSTCTWTGFQPVGKRWDERSQSWISVGVDGVMTEFAPEVIVTLEEVDYCDDRIELTWSVRNNGDGAVTLPLTSANIEIRDPLGNEYVLADTASRPATLRVQPGEQARGVAVVQRPVNQNAASLLVRLRNEPFGEASFLVSLQ